MTSIAQQRVKAVCHAKKDSKGKRLVWRAEPRVEHENRLGPKPQSLAPLFGLGGMEVRGRGVQAVQGLELLIGSCDAHFRANLSTMSQ
jgi:hypothetical protein